MAILEGLQIDVEVKFKAPPNSEWEVLEQFDTLQTLADPKTSISRWTTGIQVRSSCFRFVILLSKSFDWGPNDALLLTLSCDEGTWVKEYPIVVLKEFNQALLDRFPALGCMKPLSNSKHVSKFTLGSLYLPLSPSDAVAPYYYHTFAFKKCKTFSASRGCATYTDELHSCRIGVQLIQICPLFKPESFKLKDISRSKTDANRARAALAQKNINIATSPRCELGKVPKHVPKEVRTLEYPSYKIISIDKKTFVIVYYGESLCEGRVNKVEVVSQSRSGSSKLRNGAIGAKSSSPSDQGIVEELTNYGTSSCDDHGSDDNMFFPEFSSTVQSEGEPSQDSDEDTIIKESKDEIGDIASYDSVTEPVILKQFNICMDGTRGRTVLKHIEREVNAAVHARNGRQQAQIAIVANIRYLDHQAEKEQAEIKDTIYAKKETIAELEAELDALAIKEGKVGRERERYRYELAEALAAVDAIKDVNVAENYLVDIQNNARRLREHETKECNFASTTALSTRKRRRSESTEPSRYT